MRVIEIGLGYGFAALHILDADPSLQLVTLDPYQRSRFANVGLQLVDEGDASERLEFIGGASEIELPRLIAAGRQFDFAFVDGNHRFDGVFLDLVYLGWLVKAGGVIFLDDYQLPSVAKAVTFFNLNLGWSVEETSDEDPTHGWAVVRTADPPRERDYRHFVDF